MPARNAGIWGKQGWNGSPHAAGSWRDGHATGAEAG